MHHGFCSVEADIHLVGDQLLVAHDLEDVTPERTLEYLYLKPLRERVEKNRGRVFRNGPTFTLLIDIKSDAEPTYRALHRVLENDSEMLTVYRRGQPIVPGAVTVIISGNRPRELMAGQPVRYAALDGRLSDLPSDPPRTLIPLISDNWRNHFEWTGEGAITESERTKLGGLVKQAHAQGRRLRFWAVPDQPAVWKVLWEEGVDLINTDKLEGLGGFLRGR